MKFYRLERFLRDKAGDGDGGGGAGKPAGDPKPGGDPKPAPDMSKMLSDLQAANTALMERLAKLEGSGKPPADEDLREKARKQREADDQSSNNSKQLENALRFSMGAETWLKNNSTLLPKDTADIFKAAEKENFSNAIEKDAAVKTGVIQSFFSVQENLDLLTPGLKSSLEDWLKLTKTGKETKAQQIFDSVFEPTFEMKRRLKKADALAKGFGASSDENDAYKTKMMNLSRKHYLGEKQ